MYEINGTDIIYLLGLSISYRINLQATRTYNFIMKQATRGRFRLCDRLSNRLSHDQAVPVGFAVGLLSQEESKFQL